MISIVVPCYNAERTLKKAVRSLCDQTEHLYQIVLIDDGSSDETVGLCDELALSDRRIKVVHQSNRGLMGAWKRGVTEADGDYIIFCDADDYIDNDLIKRVDDIISSFSPELILYGLVTEYSNGDSVRSKNRLNEGYYDEATVKNVILPQLLSDGGMQSELIIKSRWTKAFRKDVLLSVMPLLNEEVSQGEDQLTMFAVMQIARSVYCMGDYCPYHYIRTSESMIGGFDPKVFDKIELLYNELFRIANHYSYNYEDQLLQGKLSELLLYVKKYICRSSEGYRRTRSAISRVRESNSFNECIRHCSVSGYDAGSKLFAGLYIRKMYYLLYYATRLYDRVRKRDV